MSQMKGMTGPAVRRYKPGGKLEDGEARVAVKVTGQSSDWAALGQFSEDGPLPATVLWNADSALAWKMRGLLQAMFGRVVETNPAMLERKPEFVGMLTLRQQLADVQGSTGQAEINAFAAGLNSAILGVYGAVGGDAQLTTEFMMGFVWAQCAAVFNEQTDAISVVPGSVWPMWCDQWRAALQKLPAYDQTPARAVVVGFGASRLGKRKAETAFNWFDRIQAGASHLIGEIAARYPEFAAVAKNAGYGAVVGAGTGALVGATKGGWGGAVRGAAAGAVEGAVGGAVLSGSQEAAASLGLGTPSAPSTTGAGVAPAAGASASAGAPAGVSTADLLAGRSGNP